MAGMKRATIPSGVRRGQPPARTPRAPEPDPPERADAAPAARRPRGDRRPRPAATATTTASGRASSAVADRPPVPLAAVPGTNPYAGQRRIPMNHLIFEGISGRLRELSKELVDAGFGKRSASQAQLANAILHFYLPPDADAAGELIAQWTALTVVPIPSNPYRGQKRKPMNHLFFESLPRRLGELSEQLVEAGYPERSASQAQLTQAVLHAGMPADVGEAGELLQRWLLLLTAAGPR